MIVLIPMAGEGSRTKEYYMPKPLIRIKGKTMIEWAVDTLGVPATYVFVIQKKHEYFHGLGTFLKQTYPCEVVEIDGVTEGAACTCLLAKEHIDNGQELIVTNCDQIMSWDAQRFTDFISADEAMDGAVVTYPSTKASNSYAWIDENGAVTHIEEKGAISPYSLNGIHYYRRGEDFVWSAEKMVRENIRAVGEFYVSLTYNWLVGKGRNIGIYHIPAEEHFAIGTTDDIERYIALCR